MQPVPVMPVNCPTCRHCHKIPLGAPKPHLPRALMHMPATPGGGPLFVTFVCTCVTANRCAGVLHLDPLHAVRILQDHRDLHIVHYAPQTRPAPALPALTTDDADVWTTLLAKVHTVDNLEVWA